MSSEIIDADKEFSTADMANNSSQSSTILRIPPSFVSLKFILSVIFNNL